MADDEKPKNEKATDHDLGAEDRDDDPYDGDSHSELATEVVDEHSQAADRSKALIIAAVLGAAIVLIVLVLLFLLRGIGSVGGEYCPGTDLGNRIGSGADTPCDRSIEAG